MGDQFDPYHKWLGIPPECGSPDHYRLLGLKRFEDDDEVIEHACDARMAHVKSFQIGQHSELAQQILDKLAQARICLLDRVRKAKYDERLQSGVATSESLELGDAPSEPDDSERIEQLQRQIAARDRGAIESPPEPRNIQPPVWRREPFQSEERLPSEACGRAEGPQAEVGISTPEVRQPTKVSGSGQPRPKPRETSQPTAVLHQVAMRIRQRRLQKRLYRFALYGSSGSGKSCILAALSMDRQPHPEGLTCKRFPVQPGDPPELATGAEWLDKARESLSRAEPPEPTPVNLDPPPRYRYELTVPGNGPCIFELFDYSGELINPDDEAVAESAANRLKEHFWELDGLLVLAETPCPDGTTSDASKLRRLEEAFGSLRASRSDERRTPTALLLTKWDRYARIQFDYPDAERERVQRFLAEHPSHQTLLQDLRSGVGDSTVEPRRAEAVEVPDPPEIGTEMSGPSRSPATVEPRCRAFPVSTFGRSTTNAQGDEVPAQTKPLLESFGLEDPFAWLVHRSDACELEHLSRLVSGGWKCLLPAFLLYTPVRQASRLVARAPAESDHRRAARRLFWRSQLNLWGSVLLYVGATVAILVASRFYLSAQAERAAYEAFRDASVETAKRDAAGKYLNDFPAGARRGEVQRWLDGYTARRKELENGNALDNFVKDLEETKRQWPGKRKLDKLQEIRRRAEQPASLFPHPKNVTNEQIETCQRKAAEVRGLIQDLTEWLDFRGKVETAIDEGCVRDAVRLLRDREPRDDRWEDLLWEALSSKVPRAMKMRITELKSRAFPTGKKETWDEAYDYLSVCVSSLETLDNVCPQKLSPQLEYLQDLYSKDWRLWLEDEHDKSLYNRVLRYRTETACTEYLDGSPSKGMSEEVKGYLDYLRTRDEPRTLTLKAKVVWGSKCHQGKGNTIEVLVDGKRAIWVGNAIAKPNTSLVDLPPHIFVKRRTDTVSIGVKIVRVDTYSPDEDNGSTGTEPETPRVEDLHNSIFDLYDENAILRSQVVFTVDGLPQELYLPPRRSKR